jgi:predicted ArsR family transcriptional regulator
MSNGAQTWAWKQQCSSSAKMVLLALADHSDDDGICWPGRKGIAKKVGITPRNVTRHLATLIRLGIIRSIERTRPDGSRTSNQYYLVGVSELTGGMDTDDQGYGRQCPGVWTPVSRG